MAMTEMNYMSGGGSGGGEITQQVYAPIPSSVTINIDNDKLYSIIGFNYGYSGRLKLIINNGVLTEIEKVSEGGLGYSYSNNVLTLTGSSGWGSGYTLTVIE